MGSVDKTTETQVITTLKRRTLFGIIAGKIMERPPYRQWNLSLV